MELKNKLDPKIIFVVFYAFLFIIYLVFCFKSASASYYDVNGRLLIPSINFHSDITHVDLVDGELKTPDTIVGEYSNNNKTFLFGHSSTVFSDLKNLSVGDTIIYNNAIYKVVSISVTEKINVDMRKILSDSPTNSLIIMTCAGDDLDNSDSTHRLLITAVQ